VTERADDTGLCLDRSVRSFRNGTVLVGGHPGRVIVLTRLGADGLRQWLENGRPTAATRRLGRRLVAAGLAHPVAPEGNGSAGAGPMEVTVVVPTRDRSESLDRCLKSLGTGTTALVVDDGSDDPDALAEV
jgi:hypothetical protein